ncbi:MAG: VOC family protein [Candidatus Limiplasma sp.]|nr:VOC family protein [Candidatus Limiplasma sp.]
MENPHIPQYVLLQTEDVDSARRWLCNELFFEASDNGDLCSGDFTLRLTPGPARMVAAPPSGTYHTGFAHIALAAADIDEALSYCRARDMTLQTDQGVSFVNPKVFGQGERYFNILTPFGVTVEVAQRIEHPCAKSSLPLRGLDHLGVPCANFTEELAAFAALGFTPLFQPVENENPAEGRIRCCMLSDRFLTLELYQFLDQTPLPMPDDAPLRGVGCYPRRMIPGRLRLFEKETSK